MDRRAARPRALPLRAAYSILTRAVEHDVLPACQRYGMGVITYSPLAGGWLSGRYRHDRTAADPRVDVSSRQSIHALVETATKSGDVTGLIHAAGVSPSQASPETILAVDLYGTAVVLEEFGNIVARGGAGVVIASQSGHRLA
jgi:aryl-alcohol dehydrogenase-like predicted oxidoreductase